MLPLLLASALGKYLELETMEQARSVMAANPVVFIKFHKTGCATCERIAPEFARAASFFDDFPFLGANCFDVNQLCQDYDIIMYPTIGLINQTSTTRRLFEGDRSADGFADFIEAETGLRGKRPPRKLAELTPITYSNFQSEFNCTFIVFYTPGCSHCLRVLPEVHLASNAFEYETAAKLGIVNCHAFGQLCESQDANQYPVAKLLKNGQPVATYTGEKTHTAIVGFVNEQCRTKRRLDGFLADDVGVIEAANPIVKEFLRDIKNKETIEKMKQVEGSDFYVKLMERIESKGIEAAKKDVEVIEGMLKQRKGSGASLDGMKKRLNVLNRFVDGAKEKSEL
jgi:thiol-disulfide isomerase/thioredoxin